MTSYNKQDQTIALAGVMQSAKLVQQMAREGKISGAAMETSLESLFKIDSKNVIDVYGSVSGVITGLRTLHRQMSGDTAQQDMEITRYIIALLHLEKKVSRNQKMLQHIATELERIKGQMNYFSLMHENVLASLATLYQETISTLMPRIIVQGEPSYLSQQTNANKIRALLLAGIRSAVLWRQTGGNRWQFIFGRGAYLKTTKELLDSVASEH
jgi:high frequency lysogenization protein